MSRNKHICGYGTVSLRHGKGGAWLLQNVGSLCSLFILPYPAD